MKENIMVSICCITYNHKNYIKEAIESFLMQKTNFKFEIIIQDDCSTDGTDVILNEYENIENICIIRNNENQCSKIGLSNTLLNAIKRCKGKYIALCEGDDFWIDENKLQKQVDYMECNLECSFCFHNAKKLNMLTNELMEWKNINKKFEKKDNIYDSGELLLLGFIPTASYLFRKENVNKIPDWFGDCIVGDMPLNLIMSSFGYAYHMDQEMSVYRTNIGTSATDTMLKSKNDKEAIEYWNKIIQMIDKFDKYSKYKYTNNIEIYKYQIEVYKLTIKKEYNKFLFSTRYRRLMTNKAYVREVIRITMPKIYYKIKELKNLWKKTK